MLLVEDVPNAPLPYQVPFSSRDFTLQPVEELARNLHISRAFLRLSFSAGCPKHQEEASAAGVLLWLFDHYEEVRRLAGLRPLAPVDDLPQVVTARLRMGNALATLLEFGRTRATNWRQKRELRLALEGVDALLDHGPTAPP